MNITRRSVVASMSALLAPLPGAHAGNLFGQAARHTVVADPHFAGGRLLLRQAESLRWDRHDPQGEIIRLLRQLQSQALHQSNWIMFLSHADFLLLKDMAPSIGLNIDYACLSGHGTNLQLTGTMAGLPPGTADLSRMITDHQLTDKRRGVLVHASRNESRSDGNS